MDSVSTTILLCHYNETGSKVYFGGLLRGGSRRGLTESVSQPNPWLIDVKDECMHRPGAACVARPSSMVLRRFIEGISCGCGKKK